jgi:hypothetical protein
MAQLWKLSCENRTFPNEVLRELSNIRRSNPKFDKDLCSIWSTTTVDCSARGNAHVLVDAASES